MLFLSSVFTAVTALTIFTIPTMMDASHDNDIATRTAARQEHTRQVCWNETLPPVLSWSIDVWELLDELTATTTTSNDARVELSHSAKEDETTTASSVIANDHNERFELSHSANEEEEVSSSSSSHGVDNDEDDQHETTPVTIMSNAQRFLDRAMKAMTRVGTLLPVPNVQKPITDLIENVTAAVVQAIVGTGNFPMMFNHIDRTGIHKIDYVSFLGDLAAWTRLNKTIEFIYSAVILPGLPTTIYNYHDNTNKVPLATKQEQSWTNIITTRFIDMIDPLYNDVTFKTAAFVNPCNLTKYHLGFPYGIISNRFFNSVHVPPCPPPPKKYWWPIQYILDLIIVPTKDDTTGLIPRVVLDKAKYLWLDDELDSLVKTLHPFANSKWFMSYVESTSLRMEVQEENKLSQPTDVTPVLEIWYVALHSQILDSCVLYDCEDAIEVQQEMVCKD